MVYVVCLKWGGCHGDISLERASGEFVYGLKRGPLGYSREFAVVDAEGNEDFRVNKAPKLLGSTYRIQSDGRTVGTAGSNWCWSRGYMELTGLLPVCCKYGWGMKTTLALMAGTENVASIALQSGFGVRGHLLIDDTVFDEPRFLVGCAMIFHDWTSRG